MTEVRIEPATAVSAAAIERCLATVVDRDPLVIPVEFEPGDHASACVARAGDTVVGVGWLRALGEADDAGHRVELRVSPGHRRQGIGAALFDRLDDGAHTLLASCDAGQLRVRRFLEVRGFDPIGVIFVQRWDGEPDDVPRAFESVALGDPRPTDDVAALLAAASADGWPPPMFGPALLAAPDTRLRVARLGDTPIGVIAARRIDGAWTVGGLAVMPSARGRGAGRALLCELMRAAAGDDLGVVLRVGHEDERALAWVRRLGFWTCRSFVAYRRPARPTALDSDVLA